MGTELGSSVCPADSAAPRQLLTVSVPNGGSEGLLKMGDLGDIYQLLVVSGQ